MSPADGIRARNRAAIETEILQVARAHLAAQGAAALSLRAIARDVGMVSSALYRYVASRDELLTLLIIGAYTELADAVDAAHDAVPAAEHRARFGAVAHTLRAWALAHPHDWALLYGSPVPDYDAPGERTTEPGTRVTMLLSEILDDASRVGALSPRASATDADAMARAQACIGAMLADPELAVLHLNPVAMLAGVQSWSVLVGAVSREVFQMLGPDFATPDLFDDALAIACDLVLRSAE
ncbi:MAG: TetR-like C-terminal domain-containing protein [Ornithinibacter sp.]